MYRDVPQYSAIPELRVYGFRRYVVVGQLCYGRRWRRWKCHRGWAMSKRLCSIGRMYVLERDNDNDCDVLAVNAALRVSSESCE